MRVISIWQPFATLIVAGFKTIETRKQPAFSGMVGTRIGIAATKIIRPEQRLAVADPEFAAHYQATGLPPLDELPAGAVIGSVLLNSVDPIDDETIEDLTPAEFSFGWYSPGRFAWRLRDPVAFGPYLACGQQGVWHWKEPDGLAEEVEEALRPQARPAHLRSVFPDQKQRHHLLGRAANDTDFPVRS